MSHISVSLKVVMLDVCGIIRLSTKSSLSYFLLSIDVFDSVLCSSRTIAVTRMA